METAPRNCRFLSLVVVELVLNFLGRSPISGYRFKIPSNVCATHTHIQHAPLVARTPLRSRCLRASTTTCTLGKGTRRRPSSDTFHIATCIARYQPICRSVSEEFFCINFGGFSRRFSWRIFLGTFSHKNEEKKSGDAKLHGKLPFYLTVLRLEPYIKHGTSSRSVKLRKASFSRRENPQKNPAAQK